MRRLVCTWGSIGHKFVNEIGRPISGIGIDDIGRPISGITKNPMSSSYILQAIPIAVQWGNVHCVTNGEAAFEEHEEIFK